MEISIRKLFLGLLVIAGILLALHFTRIRKFDLNTEANVPTWYSNVLLFSVALGSLGLYAAKRRINRPGFFERYFWLGFGSFYAFLSLDEVAQLHETINRRTPISWVFVYAPVAALFFLLSAYYFLAVRQGDKAVVYWILGGLIVFAAGSMGLELVAFVGKRLDWWTTSMSRVEEILEEVLEMAGTTMVLMGCLRELGHYFQFRHNQPPEPENA